MSTTKSWYLIALCFVFTSFWCRLGHLTSCSLWKAQFIPLLFPCQRHQQLRSQLWTSVKCYHLCSLSALLWLTVVLQNGLHEDYQNLGPFTSGVCVWIEALVLKKLDTNHCKHLWRLVYACGSYRTHLQPFGGKFLSVEDGFALLAILAQCSYEIIRKMLCIPQDQRDSETVGVLTRST